jgi:viroplasmin and RNaseH domain-containing protein
MPEGDQSHEVVTRPLECPADVYRSLYSSNNTVCLFSPDRKISVDTISSELKTLNEELKDIAFLKSELLSYQERIFQNINLLQKAVEDFSIDAINICIGSASPDSNNKIDVVRYDLEKLKDEARDITILKSELWSYQIKSSQKIRTLQKIMENPDGSTN